MTLPFMNRQESTKTVIVKILSKEHPLRASAIRQLSAEQGHAVSKSTVHQSLKELKESEIVCHSSEGYELAHNWVKKVKDFSRTLDTNYLITSAPIAHILRFSSLKEMDEFYIKFKTDFIHRCNEGDSVIWGGPHIRGNILWLGKNIEFMKSIKKKKVSYKILLSGDTKLDQACAKTYGRYGIKVKTGGAWPFSFLVGIFNEEVMLMDQYHPEVVFALEELYSTCEAPNELDQTTFANLYAKKLPQQIFIIRDKEYISSYKEYLEKCLSKNMSS